eukprot:CAMPEP_0114685972 /NCGR_PEP_ID=MMETSP0191-20121206/61020_1 /TAXON_ID=126664 /ORGANISM="Sorites sp." /LENGTH=75 /DNA_ID=CAMNT_0001971005 /DNA_START=237 /DNA_END=460 /DNA_ORIENTATION=-
MTGAAPPVPLHHWQEDWGTFMQTPQFTKFEFPPLGAEIEDSELTGAGPPVPLHHLQVDFGTFMQTPQFTNFSSWR